jgi:hypothetical protein
MDRNHIYTESSLDEWSDIAVVVIYLSATTFV